jgi:hypothetical protein
MGAEYPASAVRMRGTETAHEVQHAFRVPLLLGGPVGRCVGAQLEPVLDSGVLDFPII